MKLTKNELRSLTSALSWRIFEIENNIESLESEGPEIFVDGDRILRQLRKDHRNLLEILHKANRELSTPASASSASPALSQGLIADKERGQGNA